MNKKIAVLAVTLIIGGTSIIGASSAFAQDTTDQKDTLVQKIADKFGLKKNDVQAVFDEERSARQSAMQARFEERLSQLVKDGKITEAQKQLIIDKRKDLEGKMKDSFAKMKDLTPEERKAQMEKNRSELDSWAKANGIDTQYLMMFVGRKGPGMGRFGGNHFFQKEVTPTPAQ